MWVWVLLVAGCGRFGFEPVRVEDAGDGRIDSTADASTADASTAACLNNVGYTPVTGLQNTYRVSTIPDTTWNNARANCLADGADLIVYDDANELMRVPSGDWLGLTDQVTEDTFVTVRGAVATFLPWQAGEPDGGTVENCVRLDDSTSTFADRSCNEVHNWVCECQ